MEGRARCAKFPFMSVSGGIFPFWVSPLSRVRPLFRSSPFSVVQVPWKLPTLVLGRAFSGKVLQLDIWAQAEP